MKTFLAAFCAVVVGALSTACIEEAHASPSVPLEVARAVPAALNSAGDSVFNTLKVSDGTGFAVTVAAAGTPVAVTHATLITAPLEDGSGCISDTAISGRFTIAKGCGVGKVLLRACLTDAIGEDAATWTAGIYRTRSATVTAQSPLLTEIEGATAARDSEGCVEAVVTTAEGDTYDVRVDSGTNADTVTIRQMSFLAHKLAGA